MNTAHTNPISFFCPGCTHILRVEGSMSGQRTDCPTCSSPVTVPTASQQLLEDVPVWVLPPGLRAER